MHNGEQVWGRLKGHRQGDNPLFDVGDGIPGSGPSNRMSGVGAEGSVVLGACAILDVQSRVLYEGEHLNPRQEGEEVNHVGLG